MGMFDKWFGSKPSYPPLPADNQAKAVLDECQHELEELTHRVRENLEVVPAEHSAYVFVGKPPKRFGIAWVHDGKVSSLKELAEENHLSPAKVEKLVDQLREAYLHAGDAPRYTAHIGDKDVVVIPSPGLEHEVHDIIEGVRH
ncbi:MAG: hypothetical protein Kow006_20390 [Gammaproteobacteria bacterium]